MSLVLKKCLISVLISALESIELADRLHHNLAGAPLLPHQEKFLYQTVMRHRELADWLHDSLLRNLAPPTAGNRSSEWWRWHDTTRAADSLSFRIPATTNDAHGTHTASCRTTAAQRAVCSPRYRLAGDTGAWPLSPPDSETAPSIGPARSSTRARSDNAPLHQTQTHNDLLHCSRYKACVFVL